MTNKLKFLQKIDELKDLGVKSGFRLTKEQVEQFFLPDQLNEEQMNLLGEYLKVKQVLLEGYSATTTEADTTRELEPEEQSFKQLYEEELKLLGVGNKEEIAQLCERARLGEDVSGLLSEAFLPIVYEEALKYQGCAMMLGDLVQEANLSLILAIGELTGDEQDVYGFIMDKVSFTLDSLTEGEKERNLEAKRVATKLNRLLDLVETLNKDHFDYTIEDIAAGMEMDLEELEELLRIAGEDATQEDTSEK